MSSRGIIEKGVVAVKDDLIIDVGGPELLEKYDSAEKIDARNNIVMPGLINAHNHIPMIGFRGLGENGIKDRLMGFFFPLEKEFVTPEFVYLTTIHGCIEMAMGGVTTYCDMYYYMDKEAEAAKKIGMRAVLGETIINYTAPDAKTPDIAIKNTLDFIGKYSHDDLIVPAFAPHAAHTLSEKFQKEIAALALKHDANVIMHLAETSAEENPKHDIDNVYSLESWGLLKTKLTLAHFIHIDKKQIEVLKKYDVGVAYNPMANAKGATGIADAYGMIRAGVSVGLGTDGPMSSNETGLFTVMDFAVGMQRILSKDRTIMLPEEVVKMATIGGAKALHIDKLTGSIEPGKKADIIIIDLTSPNMVPHYDLYAAIVYQAGNSDVLTTIINGRMVMKDRKLLTYSLDKDMEDMEKIIARVSEFGKTLENKAKTGRK